MARNGIVKTKRGWYCWVDDWSNRHGPFRSKGEAKDAISYLGSTDVEEFWPPVIVAVVLFAIVFTLFHVFK